MPEVQAVPIGARRVTTDDVIVVRSPYDGHEIGRVPACGSAEVEQAVASASAVLEGGRLAPWQRAAILDTAARLLS